MDQVPHLIDTDDNPGQYLRDALAALRAPATEDEIEALGKSLRHKWRQEYNKVHCKWAEDGKTFNELALCDCDQDEEADPIWQEVARFVLAALGGRKGAR